MKTQWCWGCGCCRICCRWRHDDGVPAGDWATAKLLVNQPAGGGRWVVSYVWSFDIGDSSPLNTLPKQEGLQLAEASFRDHWDLKGKATKSWFSLENEGFPVKFPWKQWWNVHFAFPFSYTLPMLDTIAKCCFLGQLHPEAPILVGHQRLL